MRQPARPGPAGGTGAARPRVGQPRRIRLFLEVGWHKAGPAMPGLRVSLLAFVLAVALIAAAGSSLLGLGRPLRASLLRRARVLADRQRAHLHSAPVDGPRTTWRDLVWLPVFGLTGAAFAVALVLGWFIAAVCLSAPALVALTDLAVSFPDGVVADQPSASRLAVLGVLVALGVYGLQRLFPRVETWLCRRLLAPTLSQRVVQLTATRADAVDMSAAELARIERDLHDGAQAHLVALALNLGLAEQLIASDPQAAQSLVAEARTAAGTALGELREVIRGIHPPLLADRGLTGGLEALALASPLPVELTVNLPTRPPAALAAALYFTVAELLTNAVRHSGATRIRLSVSSGGGTVRVHLEDDGNGGARPHEGGGLMGLRRRLAAFDGHLLIDSPPGGGTRIGVWVPCEP